jgi:hypothetical protein
MPRKIPDIPKFVSETEETEWWNNPDGIRQAE